LEGAIIPDEADYGDGVDANEDHKDK